MNSKYKFNPEDMNFDRLENNLKARFWRVIAYVFAGLFLALLLNIVYLAFFDSSREKTVRQENEFLRSELNKMLEKKATVDTVFQEINETDENIFKLIFETEPASSETAYKLSYQKLKYLTDEEIVMSTATKLDSMLTKTRYEKLDYDILRIKSEDKAEMLKHLPAIQPIENMDLTRTASGYGYRMHPIYKIMMFHEGMDYTAPVGTPVMATGNARVEVASRSRRGSGNRIVLDHGYGLKTSYSHLNDINVRAGNTVERGDVIGTVGNSGLSSGPHLHYEVLFNDKPVNPVNFYFLELSPEQYEKMIVISKNSGQSFD